jgi:two-component system, LytTR family, response regulator
MTHDQIRTLIVDDEPYAIRKVRRLLRDDPELMLFEAHNGREALDSIEKLSPDLLLLDVQMPEMNGFEVLKSVKAEKIPKVIFVTAFDQYAIQAFEIHALDYLMKPFEPDRFVDAIRYAKEQIREDRNKSYQLPVLDLLQELKSVRKDYLERLPVKRNERILFIKTDEIDWIEASGRYVFLHVGKESYLFKEALKTLESDLDPKTFVRIHRSNIVNLNRIKQMQQWFHGDFLVVLQDGTQLMLSRRYRDKLHSALGRPL